jgi:hypothetical protein
MDLIDRYLVAVRRQLPAALQDDIIEELGDSLRSEAEEHERTTGHPLTADEQAVMLKKRGHPWLMASRYLPQQQLIGPALFPYYRQALKIVVFWVVLPIVLFGGAINAIYSADSSVVWGRVLGSAWNGAIYSVGIVTIVFAILDHEKLRITVLDNWNPANLPEPQTGRAIPQSETVMGLVFALTFLVWWTDLVRVPAFAFFDPRVAGGQHRRLLDRSRASVAHAHRVGRRPGDWPAEYLHRHAHPAGGTLPRRVRRRDGRWGEAGASQLLVQHDHPMGVHHRRRRDHLRGVI